jgi:hypothetical protein
MATYREIADSVRAKHGRSVKTCWIAHVKELNGLSMRSARNRIDPRVRTNPCPDWAQPLIAESMRLLGML